MSGTQKIFNTLVFSFLMIIGINSALASVCYLPDEKCRETKEVDAGVACDDVTRFSNKRQCLAVINDEVQTCQWDAVCYVPKCKLSYSDCEELINNFDSQYQTAECQEIDGCYKVVYGECEAGVVREGCSEYTVSDADKPAKVAENYSCPSSCEQKVVTKTCKNGKVKISEDTELMWKCSSRPSREQWEGCDESYVEMTAEEVKAAEAQNLTCNSCQQQLVRYSYDADGKENKEVKDRRTVYNCSCTKTQQNCSGGTVAQNQCIRGMEVLGNTCQRDGQTYGDCLDCADETNVNNNCVKQGYTTCCGDRTPIGEPVCDCGGVKYYAACQVVETCFEGRYYLEDKYGYTIGYCDAVDENKFNDEMWYADRRYEGYYKVEDKCTTVDLKKVIGVQECTSSSRDCAGNRPPAANMITKGHCIGEEVEGKSVECGGKTYYEKCTECGNSASYYKDNAVKNEGGWCEPMLEDEWEEGNYANKGYYKVEDKCTLSSGKKVIGYSYCQAQAWNSFDCAGNRLPAAGMVTKNYCSTQGKDVGGKTVECGGETFYEKCVGDSNKDPCDDTGDYYKINDGTTGWCRAMLEEDWNSKDSLANYGHYKVEDKCTKSDGRKVIGYVDCQGLRILGDYDCAGNRVPAAGLKDCADLGLYPVGNVVTCGGKVYSSYCGGECNSEMTENDCPDSFIPVCSDGTTIFGECGN